MTASRDWTKVTVREEASGFLVLLDDRSLNTPGRAPLVLPTPALAERIADEWRAVEGRIDPRGLPFTRMANTAIDRAPRRFEAIVAAIAEFGDTDLLCYRASDPVALAARQATAWDPWLAWARDEFGAPLTVTEAVTHRPQPHGSLHRLREAVAAHDTFEIVALHDLVALSGSLVLGLAISRGALNGQDGWTISRLDEVWQAERWGEDAEAAEAAALARADFLRAETLLQLLRTTG